MCENMLLPRIFLCVFTSEPPWCGRPKPNRALRTVYSPQVTQQAIHSPSGVVLQTTSSDSSTSAFTLYWIMLWLSDSAIVSFLWETSNHAKGFSHHQVCVLCRKEEINVWYFTKSICFIYVALNALKIQTISQSLNVDPPLKSIVFS